MSKYRNIKSGGFDSKKEERRYHELRLLEKAGQIADLKCQQKIPLMGANGPVTTPTGRKSHYRADFTYTENGKHIVEDVKGYRTDVYLLKRGILAAQGIEVRET